MSEISRHTGAEKVLCEMFRKSNAEKKERERLLFEREQKEGEEEGVRNMTFLLKKKKRRR